MKLSTRLLVLSCCGLAPLASRAADAPPPTVYANDFEQAPVGKPPEKFLVLAGVFTVADFEGSKVLELPGEPLEHFGTLFGPAEHAEVEVSARVWAAATGKRYPEFGIGAGDAFGYRLLLLPRQRKLVLRKGDDVLASASCEGWKSDAWTTFRLKIMKTPAGGTRVEGAASPADASGAASCTVTFDDKQPPAPGRASVWATPYSDKPVRFDDLKVSAVK